MTRNQGAIPRWLSLANLLAIFVALAVVVPKQIHAATSAPVPAPHDLVITQTGIWPHDDAWAWLRWQDDSRTTTTSYILERSTASDFSSGSVQTRISKNTLDYMDETATYNTTFYYRVFAVVGQTMSPPSNVTSFGTGWRKRPYAPWAPYNLQVTRDNSGNGLLVQWSSNAGNETGIWVWRSSDNGTTWETRASLTFGTTSYFDSDPPQAAPIYRIANFNDGGIAASEAVQYLDPYVQTPAVTSYVPSNITQYIPSNLTSVVPSNITTVTGIASAATGIVSQANSALPIAQSLVSNETGIASVAESEVGNVTSNLGAVGSIPASEASVAESQVGNEESAVSGIESNLNVGNLESSIESIPSSEESVLFNELPKVWVGYYSNSNQSYSGFWLSPPSCLLTPIACGPPSKKPPPQGLSLTAPFYCANELFNQAVVPCVYDDNTPGPPPSN